MAESRGPAGSLATILACIGLGFVAALGQIAVAETTVPSSARSQAAEARVKAALERDLEKQGLRFGAPVFMRIFKREKELELWVEGGDGKFARFRSYPICTYSGGLGPKLRQGDGQAPEGFYRVKPAQLNPSSRFHLSFNLGYPNAYDRAHSRTGDLLMVHGNCVLIGCYAMGDDAIEEIYSLAAAALRGGQGAFDVHAFPFKFESANLEAEQGSQWHGFWSELKPAYDAFEQTRKTPQVRVVDGHYRLAESR